MQESTISSLETVSIMETWGQTVAQDGGSADHGISGSPVIYFSINKYFQAGKWVTNHL
jgi:hypothetical protein